MPTVKTSATTMVATATSGMEARRQRHDARDDEPGRNAAGDQRENRGGQPDQHVFQREGGDQRAPGRAQRLQHHRVVDAGAVAGRERAGQHQHRGDQRHAGRGADRRAELADDAVDDVERILDAHAW